MAQRRRRSDVGALGSRIPTKPLPAPLPVKGSTCRGPQCKSRPVESRDRAVASAKRACDLTDWRDFGELTILAAACAEAGDFAEAVRWQQKAAELTTDPGNSRLCRERLALYMSGTPYRQK